ncbi:MAG: chemotaxis response regulator protein-glutamate methylesterase, partial [Rhodothermales bacterium]
MRIRALVVDDSAFMRKALSMMLESDPSISVVDTARDGNEAIAKARRHRPDIITMDLDMPRLDGISAVRAIMKERPCPILMISSLTKDGAQATLDAMEAGAVDFIPKDLAHVSLEITGIQDELVEKVKALVGAKRAILARMSSPRPHSIPSGRVSAVPPAESGARLSEAQPEVVVIAVSTGGPAVLQKLIPLFPSDYPLPILVVQHMPPHFTRSLADRINAASALYVVEAKSGMQVCAGMVLVAPGGQQMLVRRSVLGVTVEIAEGGTESLYHPSADITLESAVEAYGSGVLAVIMTGMGRDGRDGAISVKNAGGHVLAQSPETCVVDGMPRSVIERGLTDAVASVDGILEILQSSAAEVLRRPGD